MWHAYLAFKGRNETPNMVVFRVLSGAAPRFIIHLILSPLLRKDINYN